MKSIRILLDKKSQNKSLSLDDKTAFFVFKKVIREEFGNLGIENFTPDHFSGQTIFIKCQSSGWAAELWANKKRIIRKINKEIGEQGIQEIKIK